MKKLNQIGKGKRTYIFFGTNAAIAVGLLIWCGYKPDLLSGEVQAMLTVALGYSLSGLGLRFLTSTPPGESGDTP